MVEIDPKIKKIFLVILSCFVIFIFLLVCVSGCKKNYSPKEFEKFIVETTKSYYTSHKDQLPQKNVVITLTLGDLVNKSIIKDLDKLLNKDTNCSGNIIIENNNNYYMYSPNISCVSPKETYKTSFLKEKILENVVTTGNGLYNMGGYYLFRGDTLDNYINFDGTLFRITKLNEDGSIRLIEQDKRDSVVWDDRYNQDKDVDTGINNYVYDGKTSRIKQSLDELYDSEKLLSEDAKGFVKPYNLCIGKRSLTDTINDGSLECSNIIEDQYFGLIQLNEFLLASLDDSCQSADNDSCENYNYLADFKNYYWSITANSENTYQVYKLKNNILNSSCSGNAMNRVVLNISGSTSVSGTGSKEDPFIVSGLRTEKDKK